MVLSTGNCLSCHPCRGRQKPQDLCYNGKEKRSFVRRTHGVSGHCPRRRQFHGNSFALPIRVGQRRICKQSGGRLHFATRLVRRVPRNGAKGAQLPHSATLFSHLLRCETWSGTCHGRGKTQGFRCLPAARLCQVHCPATVCRLRL